MTLSRTIARLLVEKNLKTDDLVDTLRTYNLLSLLPSIQKAVVEMGKNSGLEDVIRIESPFEIGTQALSRIKRIVGNDLAPASVTINKEILAGFKARYKGNIYDGSAQRIINQLTK